MLFCVRSRKSAYQRRRKNRPRPAQRPHRQEKQRTFTRKKGGPVHDNVGEETSDDWEEGGHVLFDADWGDEEYGIE